MKNRNYRLEKLKRQIQIYESSGKKTIEWELNPEQKDYIESLGYELTPILYRFKTRQFKNIRSETNLIKEIHFASKRGKWMMKRPLSKEEQNILQNADIRYTPVKYRINLIRKS